MHQCGKLVRNLRQYRVWNAFGPVCKRLFGKEKMPITVLTVQANYLHVQEALL